MICCIYQSGEKNIITQFRVRKNMYVTTEYLILLNNTVYASSI